MPVVMRLGEQRVKTTGSQRETTETRDGGDGVQSNSRDFCRQFGFLGRILGSGHRKQSTDARTKGTITMTKNEFIAKRLHDEYKTSSITIPILIVCVVAAAGLSIFALVTGKAPMSLGPALIMISIALQIPAMIQQKKTYELASRELAARETDPNAPLSVTTENLIDRYEHRSEKELKQMAIAYSCVGLMLLAMGGFLLAILNSDRIREGNVILEIVLPVAMIGGGVFVCLLAWKAIRDYRTARDIQQMSE